MELNFNKTCIFTIVAPNYLGQALTLKESLDNINSAVDFKIILVCDHIIDVEKSIEDNIIYAFDLGIPNYKNICFSYNILEHCTSIKPACLKFFLPEYDFVYYIDPDIYFYQSPLLLNDLFMDGDVLLTPHSLSPILDSFKPTELEFLRTGTFNLGFIGIKKSQRVSSFIDWWIHRCELFCINETNSGLFVDQKWIDLAPCFFDFITISRFKGLNVGYWNLHEREIIFKDNKYYAGSSELIFFHFSGLDPHNFQKVSKHQSRIDLIDKTNLHNIFKNYSLKLIKYSDNYKDFPLPYNNFDNGSILTELSRKFFWKNINEFSNINNLFSSNSDLYKKLSKLGLLSKSNINNLSFGSQANYDNYSFKIKIIEYILFLILLIIGPVRFILLKKFIIQRFSVISIFYRW